MAISNPNHWMEDYKFKGPKYDKIAEIIAALNTLEGSEDHGNLAGLADDDHSQYFKVIGRTDEDLTLSGNGVIQSTDGDYRHFLGRAAIGYNGLNSDFACFAHKDKMTAFNYALLQRSTGLVSINAPTGQAIDIRNNTIVIADFNASGMSFVLGTRINEFSIDGTLTGNSDLAVPTEKAVKTYADTFMKKSTTYQNFKYRTIQEIYFTGSAGSLGNFTDRGGLLSSIMTPSGGICGFVTCAFFCEDAKATTLKIHIWYDRESAGNDSITVRYYASFLNDGDTKAYNIANNLTSAQTFLGNGQARVITITITDADISGRGVLSLYLQFEALADALNSLLGIAIEFVEDHDGT